MLTWFYITYQTFTNNFRLHKRSSVSPKCHHCRRNKKVDGQINCWETAYRLLPTVYCVCISYTEKWISAYFFWSLSCQQNSSELSGHGQGASEGYPDLLSTGASETAELVASLPCRVLLHSTSPRLDWDLRSSPPPLGLCHDLNFPIRTHNNCCSSVVLLWRLIGVASKMLRKLLHRWQSQRETWKKLPKNDYYSSVYLHTVSSSLVLTLRLNIIAVCRQLFFHVLEVETTSIGVT